LRYAPFQTDWRFQKKPRRPVLNPGCADAKPITTGITTS